MNILIVGAGVFGVTAAIELARRGHGVQLMDPGPLPHPDASSTDISKIVRIDYGGDALWTEMAEVCRERWLEWNKRRAAASQPPLFQPASFVCLTRQPMQPGGFEHDSLQLLTERGWELEELDQAAIAQRFPAFDATHYVAGYVNPFDGWVPSRDVVMVLLKDASAAGVQLLEGRRCAGLLQRQGDDTNDLDRITGVRTEDGGEHQADLVLIAAGAWTPFLLPQTEDILAPIGQPVVHFQPKDPTPFTPPHFTTWAADIATPGLHGGWYGFAATPDGLVKVGNHGPGRRVYARDPRTVRPEEVERCRTFLREAIPGLADAPIAETRLCLYCDSFDNAFLIDHDPDHPGLVVAAGGSGHGFKFAPMLGEIIADVVEQKPNRWAKRFCWRQRKGQVRRHI